MGGAGDLGGKSVNEGVQERCPELYLGVGMRVPGLVWLASGVISAYGGDALTIEGPLVAPRFGASRRWVLTLPFHNRGPKRIFVLSLRVERQHFLQNGRDTFDHRIVMARMLDSRNKPPAERVGGGLDGVRL